MRYPLLNICPPVTYTSGVCPVPGHLPLTRPVDGSVKLPFRTTGVGVCNITVSADSPIYTLKPVATVGGFTAVTTGKLPAGESYVVCSLRSPSCPFAATQLTCT